jgi:hypothetical protein
VYGTCSQKALVTWFTAVHSLASYVTRSNGEHVCMWHDWTVKPAFKQVAFAPIVASPNQQSVKNACFISAVSQVVIQLTFVISNQCFSSIYCVRRSNNISRRYISIDPSFLDAESSGSQSCFVVFIHVHGNKNNLLDRSQCVTNKKQLPPVMNPE